MSWQGSRLGDVLTLKRGYDLPEILRVEGEVPIVSSSGITGFHNEKKIEAPGVVTGRYGTLGEVFYIDQDYWPLNTALYVQDFKGNHPRFIAYWLRQVLRGTQSDKAAVPGVNRNDLHELKVHVPDVAIQRHIADVLSCYDDLIQNNRRRMALLEEAAGLLFREWFVRLRFPGHEHTRITDGVPKDWKRITLAEACVPDGGIQTGPFGSQLHQSDYSIVGMPVVMPKDIANRRIALDSIARIPEDLANKLLRHRMQEGDVVYGRRGDIGRRALISRHQAGWLCGTGCLRLRPNQEIVLPQYFFDALGSPETAGTIIARAKGATMPNLNVSVMESVPVLVASRFLQQQYVNQVEPMVAMASALAEQNIRLQAARDLLLPRLMSGEIALGG